MKVPKIVSSQLVFVFTRDKAIRKKIFDYEESLKNEFVVPFQPNNAPDFADANIVRFQSVSLNKHTTLQVSQNKLSLKTNYSTDFSLDILQIKNYLSSKFELVKPLIGEQKLEYLGVVFSYEDDSLSDEEILEFLGEKSGTSLINENTSEFRYYFSEKYKERYYVNVEVGKFEKVENEVEQSRDGEYSSKESNHKIGVFTQVDFNSKLGFRNGLESSPEIIDNDFVQFFEFIEGNPIDNLVSARIK